MLNVLYEQYCVCGGGSKCFLLCSCNVAPVFIERVQFSFLRGFFFPNLTSLQTHSSDANKKFKFNIVKKKDILLLKVIIGSIRYIAGSTV